MIDRYLASGRMFRLWDNGVKCIAVVTHLNETECALKNIATCPADQGKGYGRAMLAYLAETFLKACKTVYVGTGDVPGILRFYHKSGFRASHWVKDFFTDNDEKRLSKRAYSYVTWSICAETQMTCKHAKLREE
ncbi:GNAT family N-acetyltransferase [Pantoea ananatis]|uniref:GNAT family N-acetyltransferase n=1 Tax=Pantoea ananas TaxID=553 RepID=UPI001FF1B0F8|nr:GNAT family N-acetyltransferase [Pantoea ananatis]MCK0553779.1 GNAT family N-acetyltransferase [Pantoea ananatis]